jgi:cellulose synthase/poly-beta-1,6-N-acetylglucosamine synthase-like glycosyltransferase
VVDSFRGNPKVKLFKSKNNKYKKAGVLNQLFDKYFNIMGEYILIMDADTIVHHRAIEEAVNYLKDNVRDGVVCSKAGIIKNSNNFMWNIQNIEYGRFDTDRIETKGFCMVAHGMFSMYRKDVLSEVKKRGYIYDLNCITEDYELTLAVKNLGYKIGNCLKIKAYTEVPLTIKEYWTQRIRWMTGGLNALSKYSFNKYTARDKLGHVLFIILFLTQMFLIISSVINRWSPIGFGVFMILGISLINALLRYKHVCYKNKVSLLFAVGLFTDIFISWFQTIVMLKAYINHILKINLNWR